MFYFFSCMFTYDFFVGFLRSDLAKLSLKIKVILTLFFIIFSSLRLEILIYS